MTDGLPHHTEAEAAIVAAALIAPVMPRALAYVSAEDFHLTRYRLMFDACRKLWERDVKVDVVTLADELKANGQLDEAGGFDEIGHLVDGVPNADNVEYHAKVVAKHAQRRKLIRAANAVAEVAHSAEDAEVSHAVSSLIDMASPRKGGAGFRKAAEGVWPAMEHFERLQSGEVDARGIETGFKDIDRMVAGLHPGDLFVLAARPSMGKTAWLLNTLANVSVGGTPSALVSLEMTMDQVVQRMIASEARVDMQALRRGYTIGKAEHQRLAAAAGHINGAPLFVDDEPVARLPQIAAKLTQLVQREGVKLVAVDYMQLMEADGENRTQQVSAISRGLKLLAGRLKVPVIALSQLSRGPEQRSDKRPMLSDLRESGSIEQDADVVAFLYRPEYYAPNEKKAELKGRAEFLIAKQRNGPTGPVPLYFHDSYARFDDAGHEQRSFA